MTYVAHGLLGARTGIAVSADLDRWELHPGGFTIATG